MSDGQDHANDDDEDVEVLDGTPMTEDDLKAVRDTIWAAVRRDMRRQARPQPPAPPPAPSPPPTPRPTLAERVRAEMAKRGIQEKHNV